MNNNINFRSLPSDIIEAWESMTAADKMALSTDEFYAAHVLYAEARKTESAISRRTDMINSALGRRY